MERRRAFANKIGTVATIYLLVIYEKINRHPAYIKRKRVLPKFFFRLLYLPFFDRDNGANVWRDYKIFVKKNILEGPAELFMHLAQSARAINCYRLFAQTSQPLYGVLDVPVSTSASSLSLSLSLCTSFSSFSSHHFSSLLFFTAGCGGAKSNWHHNSVISNWRKPRLTLSRVYSQTPIIYGFTVYRGQRLEIFFNSSRITSGSRVEESLAKNFGAPFTSRESQRIKRTHLFAQIHDPLSRTWAVRGYGSYLEEKPIIDNPPYPLKIDLGFTCLFRRFTRRRFPPIIKYVSRDNCNDRNHLTRIKRGLYVD
ncbi:hypothetical protein PUN28_000962 [Cardiocondyla obscurior]|uniref:Uncharacterized protein n=1 Tax=Cardiocondyla obscurior TaxID=286306 RepID=A0AAW2H2B1_9HYME